MGKGSQTTTNSSSTSAAPQATQAYSDLLTRAQGVAATPYQAYTGELTAPINAQQQTGISGINAAAGQAQPAVNQALGLASGAANPLTAAQIQQYQNPYTQNVVDATQAQFNNQNQQQQQALKGNAISQGALGGNRVGVAQANLAGQQALAQAPTIAGLYSNSYQQGLATAGQQYQQNPLAAAGSIANFGISGQNAALTGAGAQLGAGTVQQQTQQQIDAANQAAHAQQQAYPYQQAQWLAGLTTGVAPGLGSTSTGQTTAPAPNQTSQYLGAGLAALSFLASGGRVNGYADGGGVSKSPWGNAPSWIPQIGLGNAAPHAGSAPGVSAAAASPSMDYSKIMAGIGKLSGPSYGGGNFLTDAYGGSSSSPLEGLSAADYGAGYAQGGGVAGYAEGGAPDDPFGDTNRSLAYDLLRKGHGIQAPPSIAGGEPAPSQGVAGAVWNPDEPYRTPSAEAMDAWRKSTPVGGVGGLPVAQGDDAEELPPEITGKPRGAPTGIPADVGVDSAMGYAPSTGVAGQPAPTTNPAGASWQAPSKTAPDNGGGLGLFSMSGNARSGLLAAGLGMLASRSPNFGNAIGEGGLAGLSAYGSAEERDRKVAEEAAKLSREAAQHAEEMKFKTAGQSETARHNRATEETAADKTKYIPVGSIVNADGTQHPAVMEQTTGKIIDAVTGKPPSATDKISTDKKGPATPINEDDAKQLAEYYVKTGDQSRLNGLGITSSARQAVQKAVNEVMKRDKVSPEEMGTRVAEWAGRKAGQRTLGVQEAKMGSAAFEAEGAIKQARGVIERLPRTSFLPFNQLIQKYSEKSLNPDQAELYGRMQAIVNTYSAVMARGANITTDSARGHAEALLNTASNPEVFNRMLDTMLQEIEMAKHSPARMREFYRTQYGPKAVAKDDGATTTGGSTASPAAIPPADQRVVGQTYQTPKGPAKWTAQGWVQ